MGWYDAAQTPDYKIKEPPPYHQKSGNYIKSEGSHTVEIYKLVETRILIFCPFVYTPRCMNTAKFD